MKQIPRHQPAPIPFPMVLFLVACLVLLGITGAVALSRMDDKPQGRINADDGDPYIVTPVAPAPLARPLELTLALPPITDEQTFWLRVIQSIHRLPVAFTVDQPPIPFTDNEAVVLAALYYTECGLDPFWRDGSFKVNEIGARGCSQLMGDLVTEENLNDPMRNIYDGMAYFRSLVDANGGDIMQSLRNYKGVATADKTYQANSVWDYIRIEG